MFERQVNHEWAWENGMRRYQDVYKPPVYSKPFRSWEFITSAKGTHWKVKGGNIYSDFHFETLLWLFIDNRLKDSKSANVVVCIK